MEVIPAKLFASTTALRALKNVLQFFCEIYTVLVVVMLHKVQPVKQEIVALRGTHVQQVSLALEKHLHHNEHLIFSPCRCEMFDTTRYPIECDLPWVCRRLMLKKLINNLEPLLKVFAERSHMKRSFSIDVCSINIHSLF